MKISLRNKKCIPCEGGIPSFEQAEIKKYIKHLRPGWIVIDGKKLRKQFHFKNFVEAMAFTNRVAMLAQAEDHHPDMEVHYSNVVVEFWTHAVGGLTENDFIMAYKIDSK